MEVKSEEIAMKFCTDCRYCIGRISNQKCKHPNAEKRRDAVRGEWPDCWEMRSLFSTEENQDKCGEDAKWFEPVTPGD